VSRLLPYPLLTAGLILMWLLLNRFSPGHLVLGTAIALIASRAVAALEPPKPRIRRWDSAARLFLRVMADIVRSNIGVARVILFSRPGRPRHSGFVEITLTLRDPNALAILAIVMTSTPGTAWLDYDRASGKLQLHVLDLVDEATWIQLVNDRYEPLLKEIFE
jgi:multicomponent K+:H+ antiporter subunit E